jgi:hypothetical protein
VSAPVRLAGMTPRQVADIGREHGWVIVEARHWLTLRRTYLMPTPPQILRTPEDHRRQRFGTWPEPTYNSPEFLTFHFTATTPHRLRGQVGHREGRAPWVEARDGSVSQRRALEILAAAPPADAITGEAAE